MHSVRLIKIVYHAGLTVRTVVGQEKEIFRPAITVGVVRPDNNTVLHLLVITERMDQKKYKLPVTEGILTLHLTYLTTL